MLHKPLRPLRSDMSGLTMNGWTAKHDVFLFLWYLTFSRHAARANIWNIELNIWQKHVHNSLPVSVAPSDRFVLWSEVGHLNLLPGPPFALWISGEWYYPLWYSTPLIRVILPPMVILLLHKLVPLFPQKIKSIGVTGLREDQLQRPLGIDTIFQPPLVLEGDPSHVPIQYRWNMK